MDKKHIYVSVTIDDENGITRRVDAAFSDREHAIAFLNREA